MRSCILCGKETNGSVGAAGYKWPNICQPCKDSEDDALRSQIASQSKAVAQFWDMLDNRLYAKKNG
jgi:hypothetical protein